MGRHLGGAKGPVPLWPMSTQPAMGKEWKQKRQVWLCAGHCSLNLVHLVPDGSKFPGGTVYKYMLLFIYLFIPFFLDFWSHGLVM